MLKFTQLARLLLLTVTLLMSGGVMAQVITGVVTSSDRNEGIPGVNVVQKGASSGAVTNAKGEYTLRLSSAGSSTLTFSFIGYITQEVVVGNQGVISVKLEPDNRSLNEVVVIGYGTARKADVTGAVASFDTKTIEQRPILRVDQALVGQMAGVQVKQTSGGLGKGFSIQVRGSGSITAGNEPLYVIDGFPLATAAPNSAGNFSSGNPLDNINPNDIESIQVLKDAASAAIYGSRAANGVVLITTKRGKQGKASITINTYAGFMERTRKLDMLSADEWVDRSTEMINAQWVASGTGRTATQTNEQRRVILGLPVGQVNTSFMTDDRWAQPGHPGLNYIDWQDQAFRKGFVQNHQISASGGTDKVRYYVSGNYANQQGMIINTNYTAYSARANVEVNATSKLKLGLNLSPTYSINNDPGVEGKDNILHQLVSMTPVQEDTMGIYPNVGNNGQYRWSVSTNSPIGKLQNVIGETKRFRTLGSVFADYQILNGLSFRTSVNLDNTDNSSKSYNPYLIASTLATRLAQLTTLTSGSYSSYRKRTFVNENTLSYATTFQNRHNLSLLGGFSYNSGKLESVALNSNGGFSSNVITTLNAANGVTGNTNESRNVLISYFGRVQYNYSEKYLLSASIRRDGSSRFGSNTRWGLFPSASLGWRISEESFMKGITPINDLKLRASFGTAGNYNIGDYSTLPTLATANYTFNGANAIGQAPSGVTNPDLTWETSETVDFGLDATVLNSRLSFSFDIYNKLNKGLLLNVPIPGATGFSSYLSNAGSVRNQGWEFELNSRNTTGDFKWNTSLNLSHNANKVEALAGGQEQILIPSSFDVSHSLLRVGEPLYSIYVVRQIGILSQQDIDGKAAVFGSETAGDPKYFDANGDGVIDANDRVIVGHPNPNYVWGITNNFRYKGFDLSVLVQGQNGGSIYSLLGRALGRTGQGFTDNALGTYRDRWRSAENPGAGIVSKAYSTFGRIKNTDWLYSSDYVRVRNITLGYDLKTIVKLPQLQGARIYVTAENFFGFDKYKGGFNPEASNTDLSGSSSFPEAGDYGGLPLPRSLVFGLNVTF
ncbi:SusC/RagA family TonB-linked outer membrane protein [Spirosoma endbachense]|uniref:SusC/RagA family TonB-linked outer membrane protein n=1 Tax=Spirosoma endbachense TaxID=2666025 RepID=A0A6P1VSS1_9BACT|nr:TonB-dependent receptor [Spirosoma endbachense]QHV95030.1 SusC/RagA family TonB-linked outer membrane protein [Spirosoma endbachense]